MDVMRLILQITVVIACSLLLNLVPCTKAEAAGRVIVFGIDETGSYDFRERAIAIGATIIGDLQPTDVFYARRITHESFLDVCALMRLELPHLEAAPTNRFDARARLVWQQKHRRIQLLKVKAQKSLVGTPPVKPPKTDIWGFLAAAADRLEAEAAKEGLVIIASDMMDNCRRRMELDLNGARVIVAVFETQADPRKIREFRRQWADVLTKCGAGNVRFLSPDMQLDINRQH